MNGICGMWTFGPLQLTSYWCLLADIFKVDFPGNRLGLWQEILEGWGFDPRPLKISRCSLDAKIGWDMLEYYRDASNIEILMFGGLKPPQCHFMVVLLFQTRSDVAKILNFSWLIVLSVKDLVVKKFLRPGVCGPRRVLAHDENISVEIVALCSVFVSPLYYTRRSFILNATLASIHVVGLYWIQYSKTLQLWSRTHCELDGVIGPTHNDAVAVA
jgi:hypothetical protein